MDKVETMRSHVCRLDSFDGLGIIIQPFIIEILYNRFINPPPTIGQDEFIPYYMETV